jgi:hypothetical protein
MEQNQEFSPMQSLELISRTLDNSRKDIVRGGAKYYILWGILLTGMSLSVFFLWNGTGNPSWNFLWFAMPVIGYPIAAMLKNKSGKVLPSNFVTELNGKVWTAFCIFSTSIAALSILLHLLTKSTASALMVNGITPSIALLFGICECISGIALKNWAIMVGGFLIGVGGTLVFYATGMGIGQMLIFTVAGVILTLTGVIIKLQNK